MFDAIKDISPATIRTTGKLALAGATVYAATEYATGRRVSKATAVAIGAGAALYVVGKIADLPATTRVSGGAEEGASGANVARDLGEQREREGQVKSLPWIVGGAVVGLGVLRLLLL